MKRLTFLAVPIAVALLAGCGSSSSSSTNNASTPPASSTPASTSSTPAATTPAPSGGAVQVTMKNLAFSPATVQAKVGQTVTWTNDDSAPHNVTGTGGPKFTASSTLNTGGTFSLKLTKAGTITYVCTIHPFMKASIVVSG